MLSAEPEGSQVQRGCINADMRAGKNKSAQYQTHGKSRLPFSFFVWSMKSPESLTSPKKKKEPEKCTSELNIYRILPHHTHTTCWHMAHIHKHNIQPVAICSAVFDRCCSDLEINKTTIFQQELISVSAVRAWGLTLTEWLLNLRGAAASEGAARIFLHTN